MLKFKVTLAVCALCIGAAPALAQQMSKEELIAMAVDRDTCGEGRTPVDARYKDANTIAVECSEDATGFVPAAGALGLGAGAAVGGLVLVAVGAGGGDATAVTTTSGTN